MPYLYFDINGEGTAAYNGHLRLAIECNKLLEIFNNPCRNFTLQDIYDVVFGMGRSTLYKEKVYYRPTTQRFERQFEIVGLAKSGIPILVVLYPDEKDCSYKKVKTAWRISLNGDQIRKLQKNCPHLTTEIEKLTAPRINS